MFFFLRLSPPGEEVERLSLSSVSSTLQAFMEGSTLGEFHSRLAMVLSFHCHLLLLPSQPGQGQPPRFSKSILTHSSKAICIKGSSGREATVEYGDNVHSPRSVVLLF